MAYFVVLNSRDWEPVHFEPSSEYWREEDDISHYLQVVLFGLHLLITITVKFHDLWPETANLQGTVVIVRTCGSVLSIIMVAMIFERHIFENPRQWEEMTPGQERAVQMTIIEILLYMSVICSCVTYTLIRIFVQS